jgi:hypothetical protein
MKMVALEILQQHALSAEDLHYLGRGEQSICYGAGDFALLIHSGQAVLDVREVNPYPLQQWMTVQAVRAGVKTVEILAVGERPYRYALMRRAHGKNAATRKGTSVTQVAEWFRKMGTEVRKINGIQTAGFGEFVPTKKGGYIGRYATWDAYLDACIATYLFMGSLSQQARAVRDLFLTQGFISGVELEKIATRLEAAKHWGTQSVLIHYDNRLANLIVDKVDVTLVDWGLAYAGIGLPQELIKVTEAPPASGEPEPIFAFLEGYGLAKGEWSEAIERATLMLVLDGLAMSYAWAGDFTLLGGIRGWLQSIRKICDAW